MARAALRPSAIAQTISDWPRCMSPAVKTPGTLVIQCASRPTLPRSVSFDAEVVEQRALLGPGEAHRQQHEVGRDLELAAGHRLELRAAVLRHHLDLHGVQRAHVPVGVAGERWVDTA